MTFPHRGLRALTFAAALLLAAPAAGAQELPAELQVPLILKALSFDRALARNGSGEIVIAVLFDGASKRSTAQRGQLLAALNNSSIKALNGRSIRIVDVEVGDAPAAQLRELHVTAAYVTAGLEPHLAALVRAADEAKVTLLAGSEPYARKGVAVGVAALAGRPQLFVNLRAARSTGADFPASLLGVATVIQ